MSAAIVFKYPSTSCHVNSVSQMMGIIDMAFCEIGDPRHKIIEV